MDAQFTTLGAIIGLAIAIVLIIRKVQPAYSLIFGALIGGLIGGGGLDTTVSTMVSGAGQRCRIHDVIRSQDPDQRYSRRCPY